MADWYEVFRGRWKCPKCGSHEIIINEHSFTDTGLSRLFDLQSYGYVAVTRARCGYTELYISRFWARSGIPSRSLISSLTSRPTY